MREPGDIAVTDRERSDVASTKGRKMSEPETSAQYDVWSGFYDRTFGALVHKRQSRAIRELKIRPGDRVLDLGVGTGLSLVKYPTDAKVVGVDLSAGMLKKAHDKLREDGLHHAELLQADAMHTPFADDSFDHVMVSHVISVVSDPNRLLAECKRIVKPTGRIVVLNHFQSPSPVVGFCERALNPVFVKIGWRSDLTLQECVRGLGLHVLYHFKLCAVDFWQIVVLSPTPRAPLPATDREQTGRETVAVPGSG